MPLEDYITAYDKIKGEPGYFNSMYTQYGIPPPQYGGTAGLGAAQFNPELSKVMNSAVQKLYSKEIDYGDYLKLIKKAEKENPLPTSPVSKDSAMLMLDWEHQKLLDNYYKKKIGEGELKAGLAEIEAKKDQYYGSLIQPGLLAKGK